MIPFATPGSPELVYPCSFVVRASDSFEILSAQK